MSSKKKIIRGYGEVEPLTLGILKKLVIGNNYYILHGQGWIIMED